MIVKVHLALYIEVEDKDQAEKACSTLSQLDAVIGGDFPAGSVIDTDVSHYEIASDEEIAERGLNE